MTKVFGIIGDPIKQARSPSVFNALFRERNVDAVMVPMHVRPDDLSKSLAGLRCISNMCGLIITVPHKIAAAGIAVKMSERASIAGSANVLRPCAEGWEADLFDGEGFAQGMEAAGHALQRKACSLVGCGGAGAAIAVALLERNVGRLSLWDQDWSRCESLSSRLMSVGDIEISLRPPDESDDIAINATPLGMKSSDPLPFSVHFLKANAIIADAVMKPSWTKLLEAAAARGLVTHEGHHMLDNQVKSIWAYFFNAGDRR